MSANRIVRYFPRADLRSGHSGLAKLAAKNGVDLNNIAVGEFLLFVNRAQTSFKLLTAGKVLVYYRDTRRLNPATFAIIPKYFNGSAVNYDGALYEALRKDFKVVAPTPTNKLFRALTTRAPMLRRSLGSSRSQRESNV